MLETTRALTGTFVFLALFSTLVYLGGLAGLQYGCNSGYIGPVLQQVYPPSAFGLSDGASHCGSFLRFYWFSFAFVTFVLTALAFTAISPMALHASRPFWACMVTICIMLMMIASETFMGFEYTKVVDLQPTWWSPRWQATLAGAIMSTVWLILLLLAVGVNWERTSSSPDAKVVQRSHDVKGTGTAATAEPRVAEAAAQV